MIKRIVLFAMIFISFQVLLASTTVDLNSTDERYGTYLFGSPGTYGSNTVSGSLVGVEVDGSDRIEYRTAVTWNPSSITDWACINNAWIKCTTNSGPANSFSMRVREMSSLPSSYGTNVQGLMDDIGSGEVYKTFVVNSSTSGYHALESNFYADAEDRFDDSWLALGYYYNNASSSSPDTESELDLSILRIEHEIRMSTNGELSKNEKWGGTATHTLTGDVTVPTGIMLTLWSGLPLSLNGNCLTSTGGTIVEQSSVSISPEYVLKDGGTIKGYYPTISSALSDASSGETVQVNSATTLSSDLTVPTGITLDIRSTITLNGNHIVCSGSGKILKNGTVSGYIHHAKSGSDYKGFFPSSTSIQDIIDLAPSGWEVFIGWGTFSENINMKSNVDLKGFSSPLPTINGQITFYNDDNAELTDFKVNGSISVNSSDNVVISDVLSNNSNCYINASGSVFDVEDSDFNMSQSNGINVYGSSDAYIWTTSIKNKSSNGMVVTEGSTAYLDEVTFCSNNWDIMDAAASYIDCVECTFSGATEGSTVGNGVDWDYWSYCGLIKGSVNDGDNDVSTQTERENGPAKQDYQKVLEKYRAIRMQLREDRKAQISLDPQKYESDYNDAVSQFKNVVAKYPSSSYAVLSMNHIAASQRALKKYEEFEDYVQSIEENKSRETLRPYAQFALVQSYIDLAEPQKAIELLDQILDDYPDHELVVELLYSKGLIYKYDLRDQEKAEKMFETIIANYPDHPMAQAAQDELINQEGPKEGEADASVEPANELAAENYPNPFNPDTRIQFTLPESEHVIVKVYNSLGREVVVLIDEYREKGGQAVQWNGSDSQGRPVSSGIYFYHIRTTNEILKKKMILLR